MNFTPIGNMNIETGDAETITISFGAEFVAKHIPMAQTDEELLEKAALCISLLMHLDCDKFINPRFIDNGKSISITYVGMLKDFEERRVI